MVRAFAIGACVCLLAAALAGCGGVDSERSAVPLPSSGRACRSMGVAERTAVAASCRDRAAGAARGAAGRQLRAIDPNALRRQLDDAFLAYTELRRPVAEVYDQALITFLTDPELDALLDAPDQNTWIGRRDHALMLLAAQTGLRASELTGLTCADLRLGVGAHINCLGKGRKQRITPLTKQTVTVMRAWTRERAGRPHEPLFTTSTGGKLSRDALEHRLAKHAAIAATACPSLQAKTITPHVLRHTAAMRLLHAGVNTTVIALWLGHEQIQTTQIYLHADLAINQKALDRTTPMVCV